MAETTSDNRRGLTFSKSTRLGLGVIAGVLMLTAAGLLIAATLLPPLALETAPPDLALSPRPSPSWAPIPTRAEEIPVDLKIDVTPLHQALLQGDTERAQRLWDKLRQVAHDDGAVQLAGARLALMQGAPVVAESRAWRAISIAPENAYAWSLLGVVLRQTGEYKAAEQAINIAMTLDPNLAPDLFDNRWRAAQRAGDTPAVIALAEDFLQRSPESPLAPYYRAEALLVTETPLIAIELLVTVLETQPDASALLWYTLGRAYLERGGYWEAATALEVAASQTAQGDDSLYLVTDHPVEALSRRLGQAYLHANRCAEAESIFRRLNNDRQNFESQIRAAIVCQTPTPTLTPWIPSQQVTATPVP